MKEFKKMSSILWKRNNIWIIMIIMLFLLSQSFSANNRIDNYNHRFIIKFATIDILSEMDDSEIKFIDDEGRINFYQALDERTIELKNKYKDGLPEDVISIYDKKFSDLADKVGFIPGGEYKHKKDYFYEDQGLSLEGFIYSELYEYYQEIENTIYRKEGYHKISITKEIFTPGFGIIAITVILSFLLTSLEHLTQYYEFTRMFPWSKTKTYFSKVIFGGVIILLAYFASLVLKYGIWRTSIYSSVIGFNNLWNKGMVLVLALLGGYFILMSIGTVAGNVLGHFGSLIIGFGGLSLLNHNLLGFLYLIQGELPNTHWYFKYTRWIFELPDYIQTILIPISIMDLSYYGYYDIKIYAFFVLGIAFLILGWFWANHNKSERSGMLLMRKSVSHYVQFLAVSTTANSIFMLFRRMQDNRIIGIAFFFVALLLSHLFYKKLFNVRIGI